MSSWSRQIDAGDGERFLDENMANVRCVGDHLMRSRNDYCPADVECFGLIDLNWRRQRSAYETVEQWGRAGLPGFDRLFEQRLHVGALDDVAWIDSHGDELRRAILR